MGRRHSPATFEDLFTLAQSTRGEFDFNQTVTGSADVPDSGISTASFLLGGAGSFERGQFVIWPDERATRISGYGGDSWKATPKLTLNYGLRWDYISPISPKNPGGDVNYDFTNGSLILAGLGRVSKYSNVEPRYNNFAPRLGFAYMLTEKTVIRGGLGRSYFINGFDAAFNHLDSSYPVAQAQAVEQSNLYTPIFPMNAGTSNTASSSVSLRRESYLPLKYLRMILPRRGTPNERRQASTHGTYRFNGSWERTRH